jgi:5'(3')-deoxyribonucleotidase
MQLYLDCDGVLADFDRAATALLGMPPRQFEKRHGPAEFWKRLARDPDFYGSLPLMPDAMVLFDAVRHLNPVILTGLPRGNWAAPQKVRWAEEHFPGTGIITCLAADKRKHARKGDILVDDTLKHRDLWTSAGGIFVHHRNAATSIDELRALVPEAMARPLPQDRTA